MSGDGVEGAVLQMDVEWGAVHGDRIVAKGNTKEQARRAAEHLDETYWEIIALPKQTSGWI